MLGAVTSLATTIGGGVINLQTPSDQRAQKVLPGVVQSALAGNLTAFRCLDERRNLGIVAERQVWAGGYQQVVTSKPEILTKYNAEKGHIPAVDNSSPEAAAKSALANPYYGNTGATQSSTGGDSQTPAQANAGPSLSNPMPAISTLPWWMLALLVGGGAWVFYKVVKKGA